MHGHVCISRCSFAVSLRFFGFVCGFDNNQNQNSEYSDCLVRSLELGIRLDLNMDLRRFSMFFVVVVSSASESGDLISGLWAQE